MCRLESHTPYGFVVNGTLLPGSVIVTPELALLWAPVTAQDITVRSFASLVSLSPRPALLVLGTGAKVVPPEQALVEALAVMGIGVHVEDSRNAVGTYNVLLQEGRSVAAALISTNPVDRSTLEPKEGDPDSG